MKKYLAGFAALLLTVALACAAPNTTQPGLVTANIANAGVTGTSANKLAKINSSGNVLVTATTDTDGAAGIVISGAGTTGSAQLALIGIASCVFDGATTAGHYVQISGSVAGDCHDTGSATRPASGQVIGVVLSTNVGGGTYSVALQIGAPAGGGGGGGVSSVTISAGAGMGTFTGTCTITTTGTCTVVGSAAQLPGTTTNDNASAGNLGEYFATESGNSTATVTMTIASPAVITWTAHGFTAALNSCTPVNFTTTGALPTGVTAGSNYYVIPGSITTNTFQIATSIANCYAGTAVNTSGSQSGTHTGKNNIVITTGAAFDVGGLNLTAGDWTVYGFAQTNVAGSTTMTLLIDWIGTTSGSAPAAPNGGAYNILQLAGGSSTTGGNFGFPTGPKRVSLSGTTILYVGCLSNFTVSTNGCYGGIYARRMR